MVVAEHLTREQAIVELTREGGEYPVVEREIRGVRYKTFGHLPDNLHQLYRAAAEQFGDRTFLVYESDRLTYAEVYARASALGDQLVRRYGIKPGDRVAIGMRNYPEWVISFIAITSIGAISVSLNGWWVGEELEYGLKEVGARLAILDEQRYARLADRLESLEIEVIGARWEGELPEHVTDLSELLRDGAGKGMPEVPMHPDDDATILFTSGTTGFPKGAVGTHRGSLSTLASWGYALRMRELMGVVEPADPTVEPEYLPAILMPLPLFHVSGSHVGLLASFATGRKLVMMYKWDVSEALRLIEKERVTDFNGVPTMTWELVEAPDLGDRDLASLSFLSGGGAPMPSDTVRKLKERLPEKSFALGWGMTETNAGGVNASVEDLLAKPATTGRPSAICELRIVDEAGNDLPAGEEGELLFKSPMNIRCYWNRPDATAETIVDGWLHTGDVARVDEEGLLYIVDRKKDMVIRGGENIYCAEVERIIYQHQSVYEAAVFGLPHERLGEELACVVMPKSGCDIAEEELRDHIAGHLAAFKVPSVMLFQRDQLPRGATDKIHKRTLKQQVLEQLGRC